MGTLEAYRLEAAVEHSTDLSDGTCDIHSRTLGNHVDNFYDSTK